MEKQGEIISKQQRPNLGLGVVIIREGKVLIGRRIGAHGAGAWSIPGGHIEFGESWTQTAKREVLEETGLEIEDVQFLGCTDDCNIGEGKHYVTIFMKAECRIGEPRVCEPDKYVDLQWIRWEDMPANRFKPIDNLMRQGVHPLSTYHGKLVRDRIPEIIESNGDVAFAHVADEQEYRDYLKQKLAEEVLEYLDSEDVEELADVLEVVHGLQALSGTNREQLQLLQKQKRDERGGFEDRIILDETR